MSKAKQVDPERLRSFFHPQRVALIGATDKSGWSQNVFANLLAFSGQAPYCVNPRSEMVHGQSAYRSLRELPGPVDLAFVMVPPPQVVLVAQDAGAVGIRHLVILTSGFGESGPEGAALEEQLLAVARVHDLTILGPNGNGFINYTARMAPYGLPIAPPLLAGPVGVVLQSGALASAVLTFSQAHAIGLSLLVSMGNEAMISTTDVIDYLLEAEETRVVALFLESIRRPEELRRVAAKAIERSKPIVALKVGRSALGSQTALAHTGALVGNHEVNAAALRQMGIILVESMEDLLITAGLLGCTGKLAGRRFGVVTPSGGACDVLSDRAEDEGILFPPFAPQTVERLEALLPPFSTVQNPLDVTGYVVVDRLLTQRALEVVVEDPALDGVLCLVDPPRVEPAQLEPLLERYDLLGKVVREARLPVIVFSTTCLDLTPFGQAVASRIGVHFVAGIEHGMSALGNALWWAEATRGWQKYSPPPGPPHSISLDASPYGVWSEVQGRQLLQSAGVPVVPGVLVADAQAAVEAFRAFATPVALKIQSSAIAHKSDVGGVLLNLGSEEEVRQGYRTLLERVQTRFPPPALDGVLVSPMHRGGVELLVGILRDPLWGPFLTVGLGGVWTEVFKDASVRVLPVDRQDIGAMIQELRGAPLLRGVRGQPPADLAALVEVIFQVSQVAQALPASLASLELNPLLVSGALIEALDVLVIWNDR